MSIKHATQTAKPDDPDYDVSADEWNEAHSIDDNSITISKILDFVNQAVAAVEAEATLNLTGTATLTGDLLFNADQLSDIGTAVKRVGTAYIVSVNAGAIDSSSGISADDIVEHTINHGVEIESVLIKDGVPRCDQIWEETAGSGVTIDSLKIRDAQPYCDVINEKTADTGVTIDGTLLKDDTIVFDNVLIKSTAGGYGYLDVRDTADANYARIRFAHAYNYGNYVFGNNATLSPMATWVPQNYYIKAVNGSAYVTVATVASVASPYFEISKAGDITMLDDKMIDLGNETSGAAANATNRGKLRFVEGAGGARDRVYACMKSDADAYSWVEIANGGA